MEINKKFFICFLIVLMLFICVNTTSASDALETNFTGEDTTETLSVDDVDASQEKLSASVDTNVVDVNGDYSTSSDAVGSANGEKNIFIKNGENTEKAKINDKELNLTAESQGIEIIASENVVTNATFYNFFDDSGFLLDNVTSDELIFQGEFSDLASGYVIITNSIKITGDNAVFNNMGVVVSSGDVSLTNLTFVADTALGDLVNVVESNVNLTNLDIFYIVDDEAARAISIMYAKNVNVDNANIVFESHVEDSGTDACAINIEESENVVITASEINSSLPALCVDYGAATTMFMGIDQANPIRIMSSNKVRIVGNVINSRTNAYDQEYATIQALLVVDTIDCTIDSNYITLTDEFAQEGQDIYLYGISFAYDEGLVMSNNDFTVYTEGGKEAAGTAYAIQGIESELSIIGNNITTFSNGPNLGIYVTSMAGENSIMLIEGNTINVTGLAAEGNNWALVSGIEIQNGDAKVYNNTIYTFNVDSYDEDDYLSGISYIQYMYGGRTFDIQDNFVYTEGKYPIYLLDASNSIITGNTLYGHDLIGDDAVYIQSGDNNTVKDNLPKELTNVVTKDNFFDYFDEFGSLLDTITFDELIFQGEFADLVPYITIDRPITITGDDAVLNDIGFIIAADDVILDNMTLVANSNLGNLIDIAGENVVISNNNITYVVDEAANAINVYGGANDVQILNNNIYFESTVDEYTVDDVTNAICVNSGVSIFDDEDPITGLVIDGNNITAVIPAFLADIYENEYYVMGISAVNGIRINGAEDFEFTNNKLDVTTNRLDRTTPTYQAIYVASSSGLIDSNNIVMIDTFTPAGKDVYIDAMILIYDEDLIISNNNFNIATTGGKDKAGSAYAVVAIASDFSMVKNNVTTVSNGPNLAVYFPSRMGSPCDAVIIGNFFKVTGLASSDNLGLVSGVEVQTGSIQMSENTIYTYNIGDYAEGNYIFGISYAQEGIDSEFGITDNTIFTEGHYAISLKSADDAVITDNYLLSADLAGDDAVYIGSGSGNIVKDNGPVNVANIVVVAEPVIIGSNATVTVTVANATGNVTIEVNGKSYEIELVDGVATNEIPAEDLVGGKNIITVTYNGPDFDQTTTTAVLFVADGVITNATYKNYFDSNGNLLSFVPEGATLDFQGLFLGNFPVYINKPVNVISSTGDALFDCGASYAGNSINSFNMNAGSDHSNITGLKFINYCLYIKGASYITVDNISIVANKRGVGSGTGFLSIHTGAYNTTVKNGYFENGGTGSSLLVLGKGGAYALFDHNVFNITGSSGNILSANQFVGSGNSPEHVSYTNNVLYNNQPGSAFCYAMTVSGSGNLLENNTIYHNGSGILNQYGASSVGNVYRNNTLYGNTNFNPSANSIVENNKIYATTNIAANTIVSGNTFTTVAISGANVNFTGNTLLATVTVNANNNIIVGNNITTSDEYAIKLGSKTGNTVTDNFLIASVFKGDKAVSYSDSNNVVENNLPKVEISIAPDADWIGYDVTVEITVPYADGPVNVEVNGNSYTVDLTNCTGSIVIPAADLNVGENIITATYAGPDFVPANASGSLLILDGVVTQDNYIYYFNQEDNGKLFDYVPEGATLDFQGSIINPDTNIVVQMNVNKPVNIISTTGDAYIDLNTTAGSLLGESPGNSFAVTNGGSGSNITGIYLHNTQLWIANAHNVVLDNISVVVEDQRVGSGVGATSIRENSSYVILKNSYLYTRNNGGSTTFTMSWAQHCTIDNCTVKAEGNVGNLIYLNIFNIVGAPSGVPLNNYNTVSNNRIYGKEGSGISVGLMVEGQYNLIVNNTLYKSSISNSFGGINPYNNTYTGNVMTEGGGLNAQKGSIIYGNNVTGTLSTGAESVAYDNIVGKSMTVGADAVVYDNTIATTMSISGARAVVEYNTIGGAVTITGANVNFTNNIVFGTVTANSNNNIISENSITTTGTYAVDLKTKTGNTVAENELIAASLTGDAAVKGDADSNVIKFNYPNEKGLSVFVEDITVGETAKINVSLYYSATGSVKVVVNSKKYDVPIVNGTALLEVPDLKDGVYQVKATYAGDKYVSAGENSTEFTVSKIKSDAIISISDVVIAQDVEVNVTIAGATGNVNVIVDGKKQVLPLTDGVATLTIPKIKAGEHTIAVNYLGDETHDTASNSTSFTVDLMPATINVTSCEISVDEIADVTITFSDKADVEVVVDIDGKTSFVTLANGSATLSYNLLAAGTHNITVSFAGDDYYESCSANGTIIVNKLDAGLNANASDIFVGSDEVINVEINVWATGDVNIVLGDEIIPVTFTNGKAAVHIPGLSEGTYTATVVFDGDDKFYAAETNVTFTVSKVELSDITVDAKVTKGTIDTVFKVTLPADATGTVTVTIGDKEATGVLSNGKVTIAINDVTPNTYDAVVAYEGNDKYLPINKTVPITVDKLDAGLKASAEDITIGEDAIVTVIVNREITTGVTVGGIQVTTIENGRVFVPVSGLPAGEQTITVKFEGNDKYAADETNVTFTVYREELMDFDVNVTIPEGTISPVFEITLPSDAAGNVTVTIGDKSNTSDVVNGKATVTVADVTPGTYDDVEIMYNGDDKYEPVGKLISVTVDKLDAGLKANSTDVKVGENVTVSIEINKDVTGKVLFIFMNTTEVTLVDGKANISIPGLANGTYAAVVKFEGDDIFNSDEANVIFIVSKVNSTEDVNLTIDIPEGTTSPEVTITLPSDATGNLTVTIGNDTYTAELVNGTATVKVPELIPGTYDDVVVAYTGDDKYSPISNTTSITVPKLDAGLKANATNIDVGENVTVTVEISKDATGNVTLVFANETIPVTIVNGTGTVYISGLANGTYTATVKFAGDTLFNSADVNVTFTVSKAVLPENVTEPVMNIPEGTTSPEFTINLPSDATGKYSVTVDNETYTADVVNGTATVKCPDLAVGNHTISSAYSGDDKYAGFTTPAKNVTIPKATVPEDKALDLPTSGDSDTPTYSINLPSDATGNFTVTVDGNKTYAQELKNGSASITVDALPTGDHNITVAYTGDAKFDSISKNTTYHVPEYKITKNKDVTKLYTAKATYKVLITRDGKAVGAGEVVTINFNGKNTKVKTDKKGYASYKLPTTNKPGKYTIKATYKGVTVSNKVKVNTIIKAKNVKVKKSKKVNKIKVTLKKVNGKALRGKKITLKLKGKKLKAKTNKKGVATFKVKKNILKKLKVGKKYTYKVTYKKDKASKKVTVKK